MECGAETRRNYGGIRDTSSSESYSFDLPLSLSFEGGDEGGMERMELQAVRALAGFSRIAVRESDGERRRRKRLKVGTPATDWETTSKGRNLASFPNENEDVRITIKEEIACVEEVCETRPNDIYSTSTKLLSRSGHKTRQNLNEAEREARRMRRVLANRESARQTIRRRQALRDDLNKKVAILLHDNQQMKLEMEQFMQEYMSLKSINKQLKEEMAKANASTSAPIKTSTSLLIEHPPLAPTYMPFVVTAAHEGLPCVPFCWPPYAWFSSLLRQVCEKCKDGEMGFRTGSSKVVAIDKKQREIEKDCSSERTGKLDIDLNKRSEMEELSSDALLPCSSVDCERARDAAVDKPDAKTQASRMACGHRTSRMDALDASAAAAARRRRKEVIKLKHLYGRTIFLRN